MAFSFSVKRKEPELLAPSKPTSHEKKQLSDLDDREDLRSHFPFIMYYWNNHVMEGKDPVKVIREAVGKALVYYYPLAGRLIEGPEDKIMVDCGGQGILFVEGDADVSLDMLGDTICPPCSYAEDVLYDAPGLLGIFGCPLMLIQVTRFRCGGFSFAIRVNHTIADGIGLVQFLNCIASFVRGAANPTSLPIWGRELIKSRNPPRTTCKHHEYEEEANNILSNMDEDNLIRKSFFFGGREIKAIRNQLPQHLQRCSTFDVITACVWKARTIALQVDPNANVRLTCVVNLRGKYHLNLPDGYYGNALAFVGAISQAGNLCNEPLGYAVEQIQRAMGRVNEEYGRSAMDLLAIRGKRTPLSRSWNFIVSDTSRVGTTEVDFGWGKPIYGGPLVGAISFTSSSYAQYKNREGENGMVVPVCLPEEVMVRFLDQLKRMTEDQPSSPTQIVSKL